MKRRLVFAVAAIALTASATFTTGRIDASASGVQISQATLTNSSGTVVGNASALCGPFNYLTIGVSIQLSQGATVYYVAPSTPKQIVAQTSSAVPFITSYPTICPAAGGVLVVVNNATHLPIGHGTLA